MPDFCSGAAGLPGRFTEGFSLRRSHCGHRVSTTAPKCPSCGTPPYSGRVASSASTDPPAKAATATLTTREGAAPSRGLRIAGQLIGWTLAIVVIGGLYNVLNKTSTARNGSSSPATEPEAGSSAAETGPALPSIFPPKFEVGTWTDRRSGNKYLKIVLTDDKPAAVQRVIVNGRAGEQGCDFDRGKQLKACLDLVGKGGNTREEKEEEVAGCNETALFPLQQLFGAQPWQTPLKTGDSLTFPASCGDELVSVKVITDRGEATYDIH